MAKKFSCFEGLINDKTSLNKIKNAIIKKEAKKGTEK